MCYTRGHRLDYDESAALGADGSGATRAFCLTFAKSEDQARGPSEHHGVGGPLSVEDLRFRNPLSATFVEAGVRCGLPAASTSMERFKTAWASIRSRSAAAAAAVRRWRVCGPPLPGAI